MERRVFLTLIACTLFTLVYMRFLAPPMPESAPPADATVSVDGPDGLADPSAGDDSSGDNNGANPDGSNGNSAAPPEVNVGPIEIAPFESDLMRVDLTNRGAGVFQTHLKKYTDRATDDPNDPNAWVTLYPDPLRDEEPDRVAALGLRPKASRGKAARALTKVYWDVASDEVIDGARTVTFRYVGGGLTIEKVLRFRPDSYAIEVELRTSGSAAEGVASDYLLTAAVGVRDLPRGWFTDEVGAPSAVVMQRLEEEVTVHRHRAEGLSEETKTYSSVSFLGCTNLYFLSLLEPIDPELDCDAELSAVSEDREELVQADLVLPLAFEGGGVVTTTALRLYNGPKDPQLMEAKGYGSFSAVVEEDYGSWKSFRWVNKLLLGGLRFFHGFLGNWGLAIILLTLCLRILIFPVTRTQQVSMQRYSQKMAILKPKLDKLKEKYKNNPQKFAQEQMALLKEHGARPPLVGCLSMFITFPVFIGMFQLLRTAIELRHAPFVGWMHDLSLPDAMFVIPATDYTFNLLPLLATAAFVGQMAMAPKPADPQAQQQQKIMMYMPIVFGVMFYGYAAGLSLYMLTTSLYSIFETRIIKKKFFPTPDVQVALPAKA